MPIASQRTPIVRNHGRTRIARTRHTRTRTLAVELKHVPGLRVDGRASRGRHSKNRAACSLIGGVTFEPVLPRKKLERARVQSSGPPPTPPTHGAHPSPRIFPPPSVQASPSALRAASRMAAGRWPPALSLTLSGGALPRSCIAFNLVHGIVLHRIASHRIELRCFASYRIAALDFIASPRIASHRACQAQ